MSIVDATAYVCIAAGVLAMVPWRALLARVTASRSEAPPVVEPLPEIDGKAPTGTSEYITSLRKELVKESPDFILDCASKGLSVTESIRNAYQR